MLHDDHQITFHDVVNDPMALTHFLDYLGTVDKANLLLVWLELAQFKEAEGTKNLLTLGSKVLERLESAGISSQIPEALQPACRAELGRVREVLDSGRPALNMFTPTQQLIEQYLQRAHYPDFVLSASFQALRKDLKERRILTMDQILQNPKFVKFFKAFVLASAPDRLGDLLLWLALDHAQRFPALVREPAGTEPARRPSLLPPGIRSSARALLHQVPLRAAPQTAREPLAQHCRALAQLLAFALEIARRFVLPSGAQRQTRPLPLDALARAVEAGLDLLGLAAPPGDAALSAPDRLEQASAAALDKLDALQLSVEPVTVRAGLLESVDSMLAQVQIATDDLLAALQKVQGACMRSLETVYVKFLDSEFYAALNTTVHDEPCSADDNLLEATLLKRGSDQGGILVVDVQQDGIAAGVPLSPTSLRSPGLGRSLPGDLYALVTTHQASDDTPLPLDAHESVHSSTPYGVFFSTTARVVEGNLVGDSHSFGNDLVEESHFVGNDARDESRSFDNDTNHESRSFDNYTNHESRSFGNDESRAFGNDTNNESRSFGNDTNNDSRSFGNDTNNDSRSLRSNVEGSTTDLGKEENTEEQMHDSGGNDIEQPKTGIVDNESDPPMRNPSERQEATSTDSTQEQTVSGDSCQEREKATKEERTTDADLATTETPNDPMQGQTRGSGRPARASEHVGPPIATELTVAIGPPHGSALEQDNDSDHTSMVSRSTATSLSDASGFRHDLLDSIPLLPQEPPSPTLGSPSSPGALHPFALPLGIALKFAKAQDSPPPSHLHSFVLPRKTSACPGASESRQPSYHFGVCLTQYRAAPLRPHAASPLRRSSLAPPAPPPAGPRRRSAPTPESGARVVEEFSIALEKDPQAGLGMYLASHGGKMVLSRFISRRDDGSPGPAAASGQLAVGDRLVAVCGRPVEGKPFLAVVKELKEAPDPVHLVFQRGFAKNKPQPGAQTQTVFLPHCHVLLSTRPRLVEMARALVRWTSGPDGQEQSVADASIREMMRDAGLVQLGPEHQSATEQSSSQEGECTGEPGARGEDDSSVRHQQEEPQVSNVQDQQEDSSTQDQQKESNIQDQQKESSTQQDQQKESSTQQDQQKESSIQDQQEEPQVPNNPVSDQIRAEVYNNPPAPAIPFQRFLKVLNPDILLDVISAMLLERRILLCSSSPSLLTPVAQELRSLIAPFEWPSAFVPLLPLAKLPSFARRWNERGIPFLAGVCTLDMEIPPQGPFAEYDRKHPWSAFESDAVLPLHQVQRNPECQALLRRPALIVDLDAGLVAPTSQGSDLRQDATPSRLPEPLRSQVLEELQEAVHWGLHQAHRTGPHDPRGGARERVVRSLERMFRKLLKGYQEFYITFQSDHCSGDATLAFNTRSFLETVDARYQDFVRVFLRTQLFAAFLKRHHGDTNVLKWKPNKSS